MVNMKNRGVLGFGLIPVLIAGVVLTSGCARTPAYTPSATDSGPPPAGEETGTPPYETPPSKEACMCFTQEDLSPIFGSLQKYGDYGNGEPPCRYELSERPLMFGGGKESQYAGILIDLGEGEWAHEREVFFKVNNANIVLTQTVITFPSAEEAKNALSGDKNEIEGWKTEYEGLKMMETWFKETELTYGENFLEHYSYNSRYGAKIRYEKVIGNRMISNFFAIYSYTSDFDGNIIDELKEDDPLLESLIEKVKHFNEQFEV